MSRLSELLRQARKTDPQLGADLEAEIRALTKRRTFGLVFEQHHPEAVELPSRSARRGDKVRLLPPRGETKAGDQRLWRVTRIERVDGQRVGHLTELDSDGSEAKTALADDLVVVAEFRDRIFPGLIETGRVERGVDKPFHTVINAENFHALEMLTYTHRHSVDAIYIDPPYNTGAKDWKYNNNYVEGDDDYRHSKWLAFMERRLKIARELLNPEDSVLIVTIDEKEYLRLGLLLEQTFPEANIQMVTSSIKPSGSQRGDEFSGLRSTSSSPCSGRHDRQPAPPTCCGTPTGQRNSPLSLGKVCAAAAVPTGAAPIAPMVSIPCSSPPIPGLFTPSASPFPAMPTAAPSPHLKTHGRPGLWILKGRRVVGRYPQLDSASNLPKARRRSVKPTPTSGPQTLSTSRAETWQQSDRVPSRFAAETPKESSTSNRPHSPPARRRRCG